MRVLLQRVRQGSVRIDDEIVGRVEQGYVALVGIAPEDDRAVVELMARKTAHLRIFEDADGKMNLSALDLGAGLLVISQFTLYADTRRGRRPGFSYAAAPEIAAPLVDYFVDCLHREGVARVEQGRFGAEMLVEIHNDGPVTILLDSAEYSKDE